MKKLLNKSLRRLIIYALLVLAASVPVYYFLVDYIWTKELDEHNEIVAKRIETEFNSLNFNDQQLAESIALWNKVQPETSIQKIENSEVKKDSLFTMMRQNPHYEEANLDRFRVLKTNVKLGGNNYFVTVETNIEETEETVIYIAAVTFIFYLILVVGFIILTRKLSDVLWKPFRQTLQKLKSFQLNKTESLDFDQTDTVEFEELNDALRKLIDNNIKVYKSQKEFTENASHELQTPLAIIRNKLELLQQEDDLTEKQYHLIEDINTSLGRISKINRNLLLLSKIENQQFSKKEEINLENLLKENIQQLSIFCEEKQLLINLKSETVSVFSNPILIEILINNLLTNAIKYANDSSEIKIELTDKKLSISNKGHLALNQEKLFQRFSKMETSKGSGLGLAIVKQIVLDNQWTINYRFQDQQHIFEVTF